MVGPATAVILGYGLESRVKFVFRVSGFKASGFAFGYCFLFFFPDIFLFSFGSCTRLANQRVRLLVLGPWSYTASLLVAFRASSGSGRLGFMFFTFLMARCSLKQACGIHKETRGLGPEDGL